MSDKPQTRKGEILELHFKGKSPREIQAELGGNLTTIKTYIVRADSLARGTLTEQEENVLELIIQKKPDREITEILDISSNTLLAYVGRILGKTGFKNREGLIIAVEMAGNPSSMSVELQAAREGKIPEHIKLTEKEKEVFHFLIARKSNKAIAEALDISVSGVLPYVSNILAKFHFTDREALWVAYNSEKLEFMSSPPKKFLDEAQTTLTYFKKKNSRTGLTGREQDLVTEIFKRFPALNDYRPKRSIEKWIPKIRNPIP